MPARLPAFRLLVSRFLLFYGLWLLLSEARPDFLVPGLAAAFLATAASAGIWRAGGRRPRPGALLAYLPHFLWRSFAGGVDVAVRVLHPRMPIAPAFLTHRCSAEEETARVLFCDAISLMPGTLGARLEGREALLHLLADETAVRQQIRVEERRVAALFGEVPGEDDAGEDDAGEQESGRSS